MNMATHYNYSIIIPHKNIPKLLERCLWSIPRRDDVQIIIVDDNSDPAIVDFDHFPGLNDPAVDIFFTKEGKGAGYARNVGLGKAKGRMVLFADADDFFNYCIYDVLEEYKDSDTDLVYFKNNSVDSEKFTVSDRGMDYFNEFIEKFKHNQDRKLLYAIQVVWARIYSRRLIVDNQITFSETPIADDIMFSTYSTFHAKTIQIDDRALYSYTLRSGSLTTPAQRVHSAEERMTDVQENWKKLGFLRQHGIRDKYFEIWVYLRLLREYADDRENFGRVRQKLLSLGFTPVDIKAALRKAFVHKYITYPIQYVYYRIKWTIMKLYKGGGSRDV